MKFEKFYNSAFFRFSEKLYRLIILNILTFIVIVLGLCVFTFLPAISTLNIMLKTNDVPLFKTYFKVFKGIYLKSELVFLPQLFLIILFTFNTYYFYLQLQEAPLNLLINIFYYLVLFIDLLIIIGLVNSSYVIVYFPYLSKLKTWKYSYKLILATTWKMIVLLIVLIGFIYLGTLVVFLTPLILISLYFELGRLLLQNDYRKLIYQDNLSLDAKDFLTIKSKDQATNNNI